MLKRSEYGFGFSLMAMVAALSCQAVAQQTDDDEEFEEEFYTAVDEIVVSAQRREQTLQEVPLAVSVFDSEFVERSQVATASDLVAFAPGVDGTTVAATTPRINIRGISTEDFGVGSDPALGFYVDDVYLGRGISSINDIFDVQRIEIAKGPQGSLFGRNTTAGAISVITARPVIGERGASAAIAYGNEGYTRVRGVLNIPTSDTSALRLAVSHRQRGGYIDNTLGGEVKDEETTAVRGSFLYDGDTTRAFLSGEFRATDNGAQGYINPILVGTDPFGPITSDLGSGGRDEIDSYRLVANLQKDIGELTVTSITSYVGFGDQNYLEDTDASPLKLLHFGTDGEEDTFTQELRLSGDTGRVDWFVGASAAWTDAASTQFALYDEEDWCLILAEASCTDAFGLAGTNEVREASVASGDYQNYSVFGDAIVSLTDRLNATIGLRYSYNEKEFSVRFPANENLLGPVILVPPTTAELDALGAPDADGTLTRTDDWSALQPRFVLDYAFADDLNAYASITNGFKSGGFNQLALGPGFDEETIWSYELGLKGSAADGRIRFDVAAFYYEYDDLQVLVEVDGLPAPVTDNAATAIGKGIEAQVDARLIETFTLSAGVSVQDAEYDDFLAPGGADLSGNDLVRTPDFSASVVGDFRQPVGTNEVFARAEYSYRDSVFFTPDNTAFASQDGYSLLNLSAGVAFDEGRWTVSGFGTNVLGEEYLIDASTVVPGLLQYTQRGEPSFYGAEVRLAF